MLGALKPWVSALEIRACFTVKHAPTDMAKQMLADPNQTLEAKPTEMARKVKDERISKKSKKGIN